MRNFVLPKLPISISAKLETCIPEFELYVVVPQGVLVPLMVLPTDLLFLSVIRYSIGPLQFLWYGPLFCVCEHHSLAISASSQRFLSSAAGIAFRKVVVSGETNCLTSTTLKGASWVMCGVEGGLEIFGSVLSKLLRGLFPVFCVG
jgi:hypothetical protein